MALSPSLAVPTSCAPSARANNSWSRSAANGSPSAIKTRRGSVSDIRLHRHCQRYLVAAAGHRSISAARPSAPARFEALADIGKAEAGSFMGGGGQFVLAAMLQAIADFERHPLVVERACFDLDGDRLAALRNAIFDRILDDRLQQQRGQARLFQFCRHVDLDCQAIGEPSHFDIEVEPLEVYLLGQADIGAWVERQAGPKEGGEREKHVLGAVGPAGHDE